MFNLEIMKRLGGGDPRGGRDWRAIVDRLLGQGKLAPGNYLSALAEGPGPAKWAFGLFVFFGAAQLIAAILMFFAYNWRELPDPAKIALPQAAMAIGFILWAIAPQRSFPSVVGGILATVMIGVSMGVVGQVYQLGADPWTLFAIWAAFALPLALIARSDAHFAVWHLIATTAYFLWAEEHIAARFEAVRMAIPAIYAGLAFAVLMVRDFPAKSFAGPQPRWQRWLFAAAALLPATIAGFSEATGSRPFEQGFAGTIALFAVAGAVYFLYRVVRPDRPTRSLALFALAVWAGGAGVRTIWRMNVDGAGEASLAFIFSAVWVIAITAFLGLLLRVKAEKSPS